MKPRPPEPAVPDSQRVAKIEAENALLRQRLAEAERQGRQAVGELQHRLRNLLAVIRSVARRTAQASETAEDYAMHLEGRLDALARGQAMILRDPAGGVFLEDLIAEELLAHAAREGEQASFSGPAVRLRAKAAEALGLAIHELTVNAVKYGALSGPPGGQVSVAWRIEPARPEGTGAGRQLCLEWREAGVPPWGAAPERRGFGTEVIEQRLAYELGAVGSLRFGPGGVRCTIVLPLTDQVAATGPGP